MIWFIFGGKLVALLFFEVFKLLLLHFFSSKLFPVQENFFFDWISKVIFFYWISKKILSVGKTLENSRIFPFLSSTINY